MKPREVLAMCREKEVKAVDLRFADFLGAWQHFTIPVGKLEEDTFDDGLGFDGTSIRGWQAINESDMLLVPVPDSAFVDPFAQIPTLVMVCNVLLRYTLRSLFSKNSNGTANVVCPLVAVYWTRAVLSLIRMAI
jgi:glutamine synthetase